MVNLSKHLVRNPAMYPYNDLAGSFFLLKGVMEKGNMTQSNCEKLSTVQENLYITISDFLGISSVCCGIIVE